MKFTHSASTWTARFGLAILAFATPLGAQNLVTNPGFETGDFTGWLISGNTSFTNVAACPHSGNYGACLGPIGSNGFLFQQIIPTTPGQAYDVSFWLENIYNSTPPGVESFTAFWNSVPFFTTSTVTFPYTQYTSTQVGRPFFADTELRFAFRNDPGFYYLDDVCVATAGSGPCLASSTIPEPTSVALFGTGLVGLMGFIRRRNKIL